MFFITKRIEKIELKIIVEKFINKKIVVYLLIIQFYYNNLKKVYISRKTLINSAITKNKLNITVIISKYLTTYKEINIKNNNKVFELFKYNFNDYIIDFINNVESLHKFIYFFFKNKLYVFKIYINKHFVNNFINNFISYS